VTSSDAQIETGIGDGVIDEAMIEMDHTVGTPLRDQSGTQVMRLVFVFQMLDGSQPLEARAERIVRGWAEQGIGYGMHQLQGLPEGAVQMEMMALWELMPGSGRRNKLNWIETGTQELRKVALRETRSITLWRNMRI
jgi:hypothetical protein